MTNTGTSQEVTHESRILMAYFSWPLQRGVTGHGKLCLLRDVGDHVPSEEATVHGLLM
jgi:hypothetical protein